METSEMEHSATFDDGARMRVMLRKLFPKCAWISDIKVVRIFFTNLLCGKFEERLRRARKQIALPKLTTTEIHREMMFLENLSTKELVDDRPATLWETYETARDAIRRKSPPIDDLAKMNVSAFDYRVAQYIYVIRNARRVNG